MKKTKTKQTWKSTLQIIYAWRKEELRGGCMF